MRDALEKLLAPPVRVTDPETSKVAAHCIANTTARGVAYQAAKSLIRKFGDATANEIAELGYQNSEFRTETIRKRIAELVRLQLLRTSKTRKCRVTGQSSHTYVLGSDHDDLNPAFATAGDASRPSSS